MVRALIAFAFVLAATACGHSAKQPDVRVLGVHERPASHVFVQVTNPAGRPLRLTKLQYVFASASNGATVSEGELELAREIPAGAAVVVEVPLDGQASGSDDGALTLRGKLTAELDEVVRTFDVDAQIQPH